jgi:hypothetical protein
MARENLHSPGQDPGFGVSVEPGLTHFRRTTFPIVAGKPQGARVG